MKFAASAAAMYAAIVATPAMGPEGMAIACSSLLKTYLQQRFQSEFLTADCKKLLEELVDVCEECKKPNWDGYGALPITSDTYTVAYRFIESLPQGVPHFSVGAEPDGHVTFEWYRNPRRVLSISIRSEGDLHYAALLGLSTRMGTEPFLGELPGVILGLIFETMGQPARMNEFQPAS